MKTVLKNKTLVIYHSADLDGCLSGVIAKYYLKARANTDDIIITHGADYGDNLNIIYGTHYNLGDFDTIYVIDFSDDWLFNSEHREKIIWVDHHATAIKKFNCHHINQYCRDGVAACRLTQQFFTNLNHQFLDAYDYVNRKIDEPLFVALAGEYDIWDESSLFARPLNFGITNLSFSYIEHLHYELRNYKASFKNDEKQIEGNELLKFIIGVGRGVIDYIQKTSVVLGGGVPIKLFGHNGVSFNTHIRSSLIHRLQEGEEFIMVWNWTGSGKIKVSFYSEGLDVSQFALKFKGGGHKKACGCTIDLHILTAILTNQFGDVML